MANIMFDCRKQIQNFTQKIAEKKKIGRISSKFNQVESFVAIG